MSEKEDHDELVDDYMDVDEEAETVIDPNVFKIRQSLEQPYAQAFTTAQLHGKSISDVRQPIGKVRHHEHGIKLRVCHQLKSTRVR